MSNIDPTESRVELEVLKERLKYSEERYHQQEQVLAQVYVNLGRRESDLKQLRDERDDLRIKWEVLQRDFKHTQDLLVKGTRKNTKNRSAIRFQAFLASLLFLLSSVLVNLGTTMFTSSPPNSLGWVMIALAASTYIIAALMTTLLALAGGNL